MVKVRLGLAAVVVGVMTAMPAHALTTWNFGGGGGALGTTQTFTATDGASVLTTAGFSLAGGTPLPLHQSAEGLGIVSAACSNTEISACGSIEFLRLEFPSTPWVPVSLRLTRLADGGANTGDPWVVFGDNDGNLLDGATLLATGDSTGAASRQLDVLFSGTTPFKFLYVRPADGAPGSDFRVSQAVGELPNISQIPEPGALLVLGTGLVAASVVTRRNRSRAIRV